MAGYWEQQASIFYVNDKYYFKEMAMILILL